MYKNIMFLQCSHDERLEKPKCRALSFFICCISEMHPIFESNDSKLMKIEWKNKENEQFFLHTWQKHMSGMKKKAEKKRILASFWRRNTVFLIVWKHNVTIYASKPIYVVDNQTYTFSNMQNECDNVTMWQCDIWYFAFTG